VAPGNVCRRTPDGRTCALRHTGAGLRGSAQRRTQTRSFVALPGGAFAPREVKLGARTDDYRYEVLSGLAEGERVVISGQFMLDSESQLREAIQKMLSKVFPE